MRFSQNTFVAEYAENALASGFGAAEVALAVTKMATPFTGVTATDLPWDEAYTNPNSLTEWKEIQPVGLDGGKAYMEAVGYKPEEGSLPTHWQRDPILFYTDFAVGAVPKTKCLHFYDGVQRLESYGVYGTSLNINVGGPETMVKVTRKMQSYKTETASLNAVAKPTWLSTTTYPLLKSSSVVFTIATVAQTLRTLDLTIQNIYTEKDIGERHSTIVLKDRIYKLTFTTAEPINAVDLENFATSKTKKAISLTLGTVTTHQGILTASDAYVIRTDPSHVADAKPGEILYAYEVKLSESGAYTWTPNA